MNYNESFITNIKKIYGEPGEVWLKNLDVSIARLCDKWNLRFLSIIPNLSYNFVGIVQVISTNELAVIKIAFDDTYILNEVRCLQCFTEAAPTIFWYDETEYAYLMEYLEPGYSLKKIVMEGNDDLATRLICQQILKLQQHQQRKHEFEHISELIINLSVLDGQVDDSLLTKAKNLFHDLSQSTSRDVVLHGDLHHDNVLATQHGWKAIDPHGYIGDPVFEVGSIIFNPWDAFPTDKPLIETIKRRLDIMVEVLPFDPQRIKAWAFCKTMLSVAWTFEDHAKIDNGKLEIAKIIPV